MQRTDHVNWMLSAALLTVARAERMQQHFLKLLPREGAREPCWEPPVDVLETETEILILIALPGVAPDDVEAVIDGDALVVRPRAAGGTARSADPPLGAPTGLFRATPRAAA
ncbi:hypothetical protein GCM10010994_38260 [Chelatococcus reniformis]|uniref:Hsp20/alpha crystallin family protein n=1 Tax=Chelatococcus reniformis TaxID=1494448 RepID=A0A916XJN2_9HYPH|nr:hypothetical protein GCM10010994_38260 [Chelatococcus reniformis]